jgi:diketogulonate reductase-like aldo/keto reductase
MITKELAQIPLITLNNSVKIPQLGLGVWQIDDGEEVKLAVKTALDAGYRLIDTAAVYGNEKGVGEAILESDVPREELFVTTKLWNSDQGASRVRAAFESSLQKLGLDYIDLYLIHWPVPAKELYVETWKEIERLHNEGKIRAIGVSNFLPVHLDKLLAEASITPAINQIELHPYYPQRVLQKYCRSHHIQIEAWSPIGGSRGSLLTNKILAQIAQKYDKSPAQIVLRWHIQNGFIAIPKSVNADRIKQNIDIFDFELSADDMASIDSLENGMRQGPNPATMNAN